MLQAHALALHEGNSTLQPLTYLVDEKFTWSPTWQVWIMLAEIVLDFFKTTLEGRPCGNV